VLIDRLSPREQQTILLAGQGLTDREIASVLCVSHSTVRTYFERIKQKIGALSKTHAVALCFPALLDRQAGPRAP
jgi:DNA-binding CsgD family transcriptional regulator